VVRGTEAGWGTCSHTVSLGVKVSALSYWNNSVAVGSEFEDITILDAITGSQTAVLSGHTSGVYCLTFSSDGGSLVSGSGDGTVKLWDVQTGGVVKTFGDDIGLVWAVCFSADCTRVASGSWDHTVCLWDIQTGECLCSIKQQDYVGYIGFSPMDPQHLISRSRNKLWWWDVNGHQIPPLCDGFHISFSPDSTQFALCNEKVITVQSTDSRAIVAEFHVADARAEFCYFSPDGRLVAAAAGNTAYVWDIASPDPHLVGTFVGHTGYITSLIFSSPSSLISASGDKSVRFWKIGALSADQVPIDPGSHKTTLSSITSVSLQASAGIAISSDKDGVVKIWDLSTSLHKATFQIPAAKDMTTGIGDAKLIDDQLIFAWCYNGKIHIWDAGKGEVIKKLDAPQCMGLRISGDGSTLIFLSDGCIQAWSMWTWEPVGEVKLDNLPYLDPLCTESSRVWIYFELSSGQEGWDFGVSGPSPISFDPSTGRPPLDFIGGPSWQTHSPSWIKDTTTGKEIFRLRGKYASSNDVQWDGQYLVAGYMSGEVLILDFSHVLPQ